MPNRIADSVATVAAQIASALGPQMMRIIARFTKYVTNPVLRFWAPHLRHMAVIEHTGRRSGHTYRTPVMAFVEDSELSVTLNYGEKSDWVRNVQAAGSAVVRHHGKRYTLTDPRVRAVGDSARKALHGTLHPA
jgi:deazaflavin-dependent oxidoreductase (nitroreductase family)